MILRQTSLLRKTVLLRFRRSLSWNGYSDASPALFIFISMGYFAYSNKQHISLTAFVTIPTRESNFNIIDKLLLIEILVLVSDENNTKKLSPPLQVCQNFEVIFSDIIYF